VTQENDAPNSKLLLQLRSAREEVGALYELLAFKDRELEQLSKQLSVAYAELNKTRQDQSQMRMLGDRLQDANDRIFEAAEALFKRLSAANEGYKALTPEQKSAILDAVDEFLDKYINAQRRIGQVTDDAVDRR